ncbi:DUF5799 family protein [Natronomonas sp.]|uniref:DUF5799 family protein n=1 Tax=Natronomonas sp. TaxID=2184060 RepID=UPI002636B61E|nr:DUF5799 family protein [Natronomonas sp.]
MTDWQDMIVGDRMTVDEEFSPRIDDSQFSRQEWGLIMTAIEFEIENPDKEEAAALVADTSELRSMMPEIEKVSEMGPMGTPGGDPDSGGGLLDGIVDALGFGNGSDSGPEVDEKKLSEAERLVSAYADELQASLEADGRWEDVRRTAAEE